MTINEKVSKEMTNGISAELAEKMARRLFDLPAEELRSRIVNSRIAANRFSNMLMYNNGRGPRYGYRTHPNGHQYPIILG